MKKLFLIVACMMAVVQKVGAQAYFSSASDFARLYVGAVEPQYQLSVWHDIPYYKGNINMYQGRVSYYGVVYDNVRLRFDMLKQRVVVHSPVGSVFCLPEQEHIDWFEMDGHRYVHDPEDSTRYAALLCDGSTNGIRLYHSVWKVYSGDNTFGERRLQKTLSTEEYYTLITPDGEKHHVKRASDVAKLFPEQKKQIKQFAKQNRLSFSKNERENSLVRVVESISGSGINLEANHGDRPHDLRYATITGVSPHDSLRVTISVPNGAEIARRTFNPRLGIEGGISIIGVSGIVKPFSEEAFIDSIRKCMEVAKAAYTNSHQQRVVINSGGKSERFVKALYPELPQQAFVEYGNYIGDTLKIAYELGIPYVTLGVMLGKAVKLAAGNLDTHSRKATMDKAFISEMLKEADSDIDISDITLARELWDRLPADKKSVFARIVISHCAEHCFPLLPNGQLTILIIDDEGHIYPK